MVGEGPAPADVELMLRLEEKGRYVIKTEGGEIVEGTDRVVQIQRLWTLKHDGFKWRLDRVWSGEDDVVDLLEMQEELIVSMLNQQSFSDEQIIKGVTVATCTTVLSAARSYLY